MAAAGLVVRADHLIARYAGSMRDHYVAERLLRREDWLRCLSRPGDEPGHTARFMDRDHQAGGITARVTELTGKPGDVVLTHPWMLHSGAPNIGSYPRMMLTKNLWRPELQPASGTWRRAPALQGAPQTQPSAGHAERHGLPWAAAPDPPLWSAGWLPRWSPGAAPNPMICMPL